MTSQTQTPTDQSNSTSEAFAASLDRKIAAKVAEVEQTEMWKTVVSPSTDSKFLRTIMRELYLEIYSYQPTSTEAVIAIIAQLPKTEQKLMRTLLQHSVEEADHGEMALKDYLALGGDEQFARTRRRSPAALAFDGMWWELFRSESPFCYFGAMYPFEGMTPVFCEKVQGILESRGLPKDALGFIVFHAKEDIAHRNLIRNLIKDVVTRYPQAAADIEYGMDCFLNVFPIPVWSAAYGRAKAEFEPFTAGAIMQRSLQ